MANESRNDYVDMLVSMYLTLKDSPIRSADMFVACAELEDEMSAYGLRNNVTKSRRDFFDRGYEFELEPKKEAQHGNR